MARDKYQPQADTTEDQPASVPSPEAVEELLQTTAPLSELERTKPEEAPPSAPSADHVPFSGGPGGRYVLGEDGKRVKSS